MYEIEVTTRFQEKYKKLTRNNKELVERIERVLWKLKKDPFQKSLKTHKVYVSSFGIVYSSFVTGDLRILWIRKEKTFVLLLLDIGGHSGSSSVY